MASSSSSFQIEGGVMVGQSSPAHHQSQAGPSFSPTSGTMSVPRRHVPRPMFHAELSQCLFDFVIQLLPTAEEMAVKEDVRKLLERLIRTIEPNSRLLSFGSTANGFSLRNSDMDLCCLIESEGPPLSASDLVTMLGDLLERETKFHVKPLPHARIPIIKLNLDPSPGLPFGIACDIGFENRLALENTRLLFSYATVDPTRVRTMVLFLKVWCKRRKINSPYRGTLSSYGYVLLVIYFLVHVKNPPVLPNLQQIPPLRPISHEDMHIGEHNIWFFDDIELLKTKWRSPNMESVAELLIDFFKYYSRDFSYNTGVASIRAGLLKKESKGWMNDYDGSKYSELARDRNRLCIEDPFETNYNVARTVTKDGLYTIRGEFMRASRILSSRPERAIIALAQLCEEREDELVRASPAQHTFNHTPPRLASFPAQTPYTVGASRRPTTGDRLSPPMKLFDRPPKVADPTHTRSASEDVVENSNIPPEHMAPKRGKWTSPPPVDAPPAIQVSYENTLGLGLTLATAATPARERESMSYTSSSSNNSEVMTDDDGGENGPASDPDLLFNEPETPSSPSNKMGAHSFGVSPSPSGSKSSSNFMDPRHVGRGRPSRAEAYAVEMARQGSDIGIPPSPTTEHQQRRSASGPPRTSWHIQPSIATPQLSLAPLVPPSPLTTQIQPRNSPSPTYRFSPIEPPRAMHIPHRQVLPDPVAIPVAPILYWDRQHHHFATQPLRQTAPRHRPQPFPLYQQIQSASSSPSNRNARPSTPPSSREQKREGPSSLPIQSRSMSQSASTSPLQIKVTLESTSAPHHSRSSVPPPSYSSIAGTSRRSSESGQFNARSPSSQSAASPTSTRLSFDSNVESSSSGSSTRAPCGPNFSPSPPAITPSPPPENRQSPISSPPLPPSAPHSNSSPGSNGAARSVIIPSPSARTAHKRKISDDQGITATATKPPHYESMISAMSKLGLKEKR